MNTISDLEPSSAEARAAQQLACRLRLERMFNDHHDFIWRLIRRLGLSRGAADDAAQQVFLVAAERILDIQVGRERAFLFGTALGERFDLFVAQLALVQNPDDRDGLLKLGIGEDHITLIPGSGVDTRALQPLPNRAQKLISCRVPEVVVDVLEAVDVDEQRARHPVRLACGAPEQLLGGDVDLAFDSLSSSLAQIQARDV